MNRVFLMLIAAVAMVLFSFDVADACNRCGSCCSAPSTQCCTPRRCCEPQRRCWVPQRRGCCCPTTSCCDAGYGVSYGGAAYGSAVMMEGAAIADPCCTGGQVMDTGSGTAPAAVGDVTYEGEGAVIEGPVVEEGTVDAVISSEAPPVEAPVVPEAPESEEDSAGDEG